MNTQTEPGMTPRRIVAGIAAFIASMGAALALSGTTAAASLTWFFGTRIDGTIAYLALAAIASAIIAFDAAHIGVGLSRRAARGQVAAYCAALAIILVGMNRSIPAITLGFSELTTDFATSSAVWAWNLAAFVPLGFFFRRRLASSPAAHGMVLAAIAGIEVLQFALGLGAANLVDVIVRYVGVLIGLGLATIATRVGWRMDAGAGRYSIVRRHATPVAAPAATGVRASMPAVASV
ncbi:MAG: VanZ family protein [Pseudoscardovia radai]|nr:VanZ family protein [Pseudoscardovia radai]